LRLESLIHLIEFTGIGTVPVQNLPGVLLNHILQRTGGGPIRKSVTLMDAAKNSESLSG
jgi:hypothetical protein